MTNKQSIKTKYSLRTTDLKFIIIGALILIAFIAPYLHIFLPKESTVKVFGFRNFRTFMYSFGLPLSLFACSNILIYASTFVKEFKKPFTICGFLFNYTSIFHFVWIFWADTDLSRTQYYISIVAISLVFTLVYANFIILYNRHIESLKYKIKTLFTFIYSLNTNNYVKKSKHEDFAIKRIEVTDAVILEKNEQE